MGKHLVRCVLIADLLGILASAYIATAYHVGYPEFRNRRVLLPVAGNALMVLAYVVTGNPLSAILSHAVMHIAAVLHGTEATVQLPSHYGDEQLATA
jgi:membrane protease YdiL (CAAX protease family)